jgi:hypothetical protein
MNSERHKNKNNTNIVAFDNTNIVAFVRGSRRFSLDEIADKIRVELASGSAAGVR